MPTLKMLSFRQLNKHADSLIDLFDFFQTDSSWPERVAEEEFMLIYIARSVCVHIYDRP